MHLESITQEDFKNLKENEPVLLAYFSANDCGVCGVLKPKVEALLLKSFPKIKSLYVQIEHNPEIAAQNQVFTAPTILVFFAGREYIRKSRNIGVSELEREIERIYSLMF